MKVIVRRTRKKIVSLKFDENGVLQVLANSKLSLEKVKSLVLGQKEWIKKHSCVCVSDGNSDFCNKAQTTSSANVLISDSCTGADIAEMFCGKKCMLNGDVFNVCPTSESKSYLNCKNIYLPEKYYATKDLRLKALKSCIKKLSAQNISEQISKFGSFVSLCPTRIEFKNIVKGWLKCTHPQEKNVVLDYRICQLPDDLQYYLIVHCFAHFTHDGHSEAFWNTVSNYLPNYIKCAEQLESFNFLKEI